MAVNEGPVEIAAHTARILISRSRKEKRMLPDFARTWTRLLACPDCRSEAFHDWHGPDFIFTVSHSMPCPLWSHPYREVRFELVDAAPGRVGPNGSAVDA